MKTQTIRIILALAMLISTATAQTYVIDTGGTYKGLNLSNTDPDKAAILITTPEAVEITNSYIESRGNLIEVTADGGPVTVRNVHGVGLHPQKDKAIAGRFFDSGNQNQRSRIVLENNLLVGTSGIRIRDQRGASVVVRYNEARHIDGRFAKAREGEYYGNETWQFREYSSNRQFIALRNCENLTGSLITWNKVVNVGNTGANWEKYEKGESIPLPAQEDVFNFNASGRPGDSIYVSNNIAVGAYSYEPQTLEKYNGGGFIADGGDCKYLVFDGNYAINIQNYSFSVATGGAVIFRYNTAVSSGYLPDGTVSGYNSLAHSHQLNNSPGSEFYGNRAAYVRTRPRGEIGQRNDTRFVNCGPGKCRDTEALFPGRLPKLSDEVTMIKEYEARAADLGVVFGLTDGTPPPPPPVEPEPTPDPDPQPEPGTPTAFRIVSPGQPGTLGHYLQDGDTVYLSEYPGFTIEAAEAISTVTFTLNGEFVRTDGAPPYLLCGNRGFKNYDNVSGCDWIEGEKKLEADGKTVRFYVFETRTAPPVEPDPEPEPDPSTVEVYLRVDGVPQWVPVPLEWLISLGL